jgi:phosphoglycerate kinase
MKTIDDIHFSEKRALVRVDFNVPMDSSFNITDDTRIRAAIPTIKKILQDGGSVVLMSHLGRPLKKLKEDGSIDSEKFTLQHIVAHLSALLGIQVQFSFDCIGETAKQMVAKLNPFEVLLLENTRFHKGEEKGDEAFAAELATLGDVYVNDAFGTAHRAHASTTLVAHHFDADHKCAGYLMAAEVANATKVLRSPDKPFTAILGGAKVSDKILILDNLIDISNHIIIGGGMSYTFLKALGKPIGQSLCEEDKLDVAVEVLEKAKTKGVQILLPVDHVIAETFSNEAKTRLVAVDEDPGTYMGLDIGPKTIAAYRRTILASKTILWNGPMGVFEMDQFRNGTLSIAQAVAEATSNGAFSLIGGGDSVAAVNQFGLADKVSYVSTGGGAMLEFFEGRELPGVAALS